ncbi:putative sugar nucleotidyl transferase [Gemmatimonas sp.]|jgi:UDP-N-acetylglucosamine diphosphorylase/glucosamine-1-phosphate N-acetyltransferase|uniref:putative sugar nucleotidyl transferase n=1 Tax=Gemmatimonas sp. TaxID=1962908 RepID=UPI0022BF8094|nr:putative sugar nucleotidyl transferase [Gemmatimonas sp.]MCZ8204479.1 putative sugar nucleotidyl transferase [Gemmatimonas sp.]
MIIFYDDARARRFEPFATTRPLAEMRMGALLQRERWQEVLHAAPRGFVSSPHLEGFTEFDAPPAHVGDVPAGTWLVNTRAVPMLEAVRSTATVLAIDHKVAAVKLAAAVSREQLQDALFALEDVLPSTGSMANIPGVWLDNVWDLVAHLQSVLQADIPTLALQTEAVPLANSLATILGSHGVFVEADATIEPQVVFDTTLGPVLLRRGAVVQAFSRVAGPCYVGREASVLGGRVAGCAIGDVCRVHGELSASILVGHSNKGHEGFVGHSVLGRWVNLGAGTTTSNLKNTYGSVSLWTPDGVQDTKLQFLGTLFGDHAKTGIGLRLTTGCVVGAGANVFDAMPPKAVAPFSWGGAAPYGRFAEEKFVDTAERMMARRQIVMSASARGWWRRVHAVASADTRWPRR